MIFHALYYPTGRQWIRAGAGVAARNEIEAALERLTHGYGLYRKDLIDALQSDLNVLQRFWEIDLNRGRDIARAGVAAKLHEYLAEIEPSESRKVRDVEQRKRQYRFNALVCFNAVEASRFPKLKDMLLGERREWLETKARPPYQINERTGRRNLDHAIEQIAKRMIEAGPPAIPEPESDSNVTIADHAGEAPEAAESDESNTERASDPKKPWPRHRRIALTAISAAVALAGAYEIANYASSATSSPSSPASSSANSGSSANAPSPIAITAQLTTTYLDGDGTWVFPPTIGANPLQVITNIAPKITSAAPGIGGKLVSPAVFRINFDNTSPYTVAINSMRPVVTSHTPPASGILVTLGGQGTEILGQLGFNLDMAAPYAQEVDAGGKLTAVSFFKAHYIKLIPGDQDEIDLTAVTTQADYTFKLELGVSVDGNLRTLDFNGPNGKPFEVTSKAAKYQSRISNGINPYNPAQVLYATP